MSERTLRRSEELLRRVARDFDAKNSHPEDSGWPLTIACHMKKSYLAAEEGAASVVAGVVIVAGTTSVVAGVEIVAGAASVEVACSVVVVVSSLLLQAANVAAITNT